MQIEFKIKSTTYSTLVLSIKILTLHLTYVTYLGYILGKTIWLPTCHVSSYRCEDLILLQFYLQMLNNINVKNSWSSLRYKYQLKQITKTREKMLQPMKTEFGEKWAYNFKTLASTFYAQKKAFWNNQKRWIRSWLYWLGCLGKNSLFGGRSLKNDRFHLQKKF